MMNDAQPTADDLVGDIRVTGDMVEVSLKENSYVTTVIHSVGMNREIIPDAKYWEIVKQNGIDAGLVEQAMPKVVSELSSFNTARAAHVEQAAEAIEARDAAVRQREVLAKARAAKAAKKGSDGEASA